MQNEKEFQLRFTLKDVLSRANQAYDRAMKTSPTIFKEEGRKIYQLDFLKTMYRNLFDFTQTMMQEMQDVGIKPPRDSINETAPTLDRYNKTSKP